MSSKLFGNGSDDGDDISHGPLRLIQDFREQIKKGLPYVPDIATLSSLVDAIKHTNAIDDRKMLLEHVLVLLARLPPGKLSTTLQNKVVQFLYNDLTHPPQTYIGDKYSYRTADGSHNNMGDPDMGKAGMPYARSVQQTHALPKNEMPDAGLVFDTLLRREKFEPHPAGLSSTFFSFAALVIHTVFRTSHDKVEINETSSYVDLSPLYGHNQAAQDKVRARNGYGALYNDVFAEDRLLLLPPAVCALLVLFNRNHNYIAKKLLEINERGEYFEPATLSVDDPNRTTKLIAQDNSIFETARLINCTWFASTVFSDYFTNILGLVRQGSNWSLNPFQEIREEDHTLFERGRGNVCSVEFNCLYRWHATTSAEDEKWVEDQFTHVFPGKTPDELTITDFKSTAKVLLSSAPDNRKWEFGGMKRQADGSFKDEELAKIIQTATDRPAGAFRARGTPGVMRLHEIMGIEQNRAWGVCSLNDFRRYLGLKPYSSFIEWNSDPDVAASAEKLYGDIERLELYVGLQAEQPKPVIDGAGLCPAYTISRAILSDAIALTRGDRFYTADYTPYNMTSWGFADCQREPTAPGCGSTLGRLFLRTLPNHFDANSTYTWFPLMTPPAMKPVLKKLGWAEQYSMTKPLAGTPLPILTDYRDVADVLSNKERFGIPYDRTYLIKGNGFFIASDNPARGSQEQRAVVGALTDAPDAVNRIGSYFYEKTRELMESNAYKSYNTDKSATKNVDLVRDVLKYVPIYWASELAGIQLKSKKDDDGDYTPQELYSVLTDIYSYLFLDVELAQLLRLTESVKGHIQKLQNLIRNTWGGSRLSLSGLFDAVSSIFGTKKKTDRDEYMERFAALGFDADTLVNAVLAIMVGATVELSQSLVHIVNFYLDENKPVQVQTIAAKGKLTSKDEAELQALVLEALRLDPAFSAVFRESQIDHQIGTLDVKPRQRILVDIARANRDAQSFAQPEDVDLARNLQKYLNGDGVQRCLGQSLSTKILTQVVHAVFSFPKIRRAPAQSGTLKRFRWQSMKTSTYAYLDADSKPTPWAISMVVQWN